MHERKRGIKRTQEMKVKNKKEREKSRKESERMHRRNFFKRGEKCMRDKEGLKEHNK